MANNEQQISEAKANAISLIANSKCFIVITDNGREENNLDTRMMLNNVVTALEFIKILRGMENAILYPQKPTPPPSNIIKP